MLFTAAAVAIPAYAEPPVINMVFPPPGFVAPRQDPAFSHDATPYPAHATQCQESGTAKVVLTITAEGRVSDVAIAQTTGFDDLDAAVAIQARKWRYLPATKDGTPTAVSVSITIPLAPEKHGPNFAADCTRAGTQAAAAELLRSARGSDAKN